MDCGKYFTQVHSNCLQLKQRFTQVIKYPKYDLTYLY